MSEENKNIEKNPTSKRDVIEYLWEWADGKGNWAKLLLIEILREYKSLSNEMRKAIYEQFKKDIGLLESNESPDIQKPSNQTSEKKVMLKKLSNIQGLNRLSSDSVIEFSPNLTVIYGENGTGKSGFSRILKNVGFSYESETKLLPNIYSEKENEMSAKIEYSVDEEVKQYKWIPDTQNDDLKNISVYNNSCVAISLAENRNLVVTPSGFHLFDLVAKELDALNNKISEEVKSLEPSMEWTDNLHEGTPYFDFIKSLENKNEEDINSIELYSGEDVKKLESDKKDLNELNDAILKREISDLKTQLQELTNIKSRVETQQKTLNENAWEKLITAIEEKKKLEATSTSSLSELVKEKGLDIFSMPEFEKFIQAADTYIKTKDGNYPNENDKCIYCNQPLSQPASELIKRYEDILNNTTQEELKKNKDTISSIAKEISQIEEIIYYQASYGRDGENNPIQPEYLQKYNASVKSMKAMVSEGNSFSDVFVIDYDDIINNLSEKIAHLGMEIREKEETLEGIENKVQTLNQSIGLLNDKKIFTEKIDNIKNAIRNYKTISVLEDNASAFNTRIISTTTSSARRELVESNFEATFKEELRKLRKNHIEIDLNFSTQKGTTNIQQYLKNEHILSDILSEGEQKAISLAEYFAEISINENNSVIILDDPVNSLDHHIIDSVAKRLIELSKEHQVVVFTHSILLYNSFIHQQAQLDYKDIDLKFYESSNQYEVCGVVENGGDAKNSVKEHIKKVNTLLNNSSSSSDRKESDLAAEGYGHLRSAIELLIEHEILKGTVKRYQKNVALTNFNKICGAQIDEQKKELNEIFDRCCDFINAHSNPTESSKTPTVKELKEDFERYNRIRDIFIK